MGFEYNFHSLVCLRGMECSSYATTRQVQGQIRMWHLLPFWSLTSERNAQITCNTVSHQWGVLDRYAGRGGHFGAVSLVSALAGKRGEPGLLWFLWNCGYSVFSIELHVHSKGVKALYISMVPVDKLVFPTVTMEEWLAKPSLQGGCHPGLVVLPTTHPRAPVVLWPAGSSR